AGRRDQLVPGAVAGLPRAVDVLLGAGLDQGRVADGAAGIDAAAADADPGRRILVLAGLVPGGGGDGPGAGDLVELHPLLQGALVVARPVVRLVGVDGDDRPVIEKRLRSRRRG